jgi:hypothetical protein
MWINILLVFYVAISIWAYLPEKFIETASLRFLIVGVKTIVKISNVVLISLTILYFINKI